MGSAPRFKPGQQVQRVNASEEIGIVIGDPKWNSQSEFWIYKVQFGGSPRGGLPESSLRPFVFAETPWDALREGSVSGIAHFRHALTYHRIRRPPSRIAKSFSSARTRFYPHQFKPLLKFLDNPEKRILVGDDVGLGKTIEAGYIFCELQAQQPMDQVLIMVPARLLKKWQTEMSNRFGEAFQIVRSAEIQAHLRRPPSQTQGFRWIASYETMRGLFKQFEGSAMSIDLLIMDEAHRARSPGTQQHKMAHLLCHRADAVVMLSATPVQNRLDDLWHLLRMLAPDQFSNQSLFETQMDDNAHLLSVIRAIGQGDDLASVVSARKTFEIYLGTYAGQRLSRTSGAVAARATLSKATLSRRERIELQTTLGSLSPIAHLFTRTRKLDAIPDTARREANWVSIKLTPIEWEIYQGIENICKQRAAWVKSEWGRSRSLIMVYRALASCIPAAMGHFQKDLDTPINLEDEEKEDDGQASGLDGEVRKALKAAIRRFADLGATDTKFARLLDELQSMWFEDERHKRPKRKVVLFSYFPRTVEYLRDRLRENLVECRMIHGGIAPVNREGPIAEFLTDPEVHVLLTTDVGGEGIDLQRASVMFNYDLPWNPMVVEQRIGRIDRIGQEAPILVIRNFVVSESIEEKILKRLFDKIEVFKRSIGELDPILGEQESIETLTEQALFGTLDDEHLEDLLRVNEQAVLQQNEDAKRLQSRLDELIAGDQALIDEIEAVSGEHQIPSAAQLLDFVNRGLETTGTGTVISQDATETVVRVDLRRAVVEGKVAASGHDNDRTARFIQGAKTAPEIALTFSRDAAYRHIGAEFIHATHPLARWAVGQLEVPQKAFRVSVPACGSLPDGEYAFALELIELQGMNKTARMIGVVVGVGEEGDVSLSDKQVAQVLGKILGEGQDEDLDPEVLTGIDAIEKRVQSIMHDHLQSWEAREQEVHATREARRRASIQATHDLAQKRAEERLQGHLVNKHGDFVVRMAEAKLAKAIEKADKNKKAAPMEAWPGYEREEIAVGLLRVGSVGGH